MSSAAKPLKAPGIRAARGLSSIMSEMGCVADVMAGEGKDRRKEAEDIRIALDWISYAVKTSEGASS